MGEGFKKLKRQFWLSAIIKSAVCGLSFGLFAFAVIFTALKLAGVPLGGGYYALITLGAALLCGGLCVLLFKPNDKKVAIELDKRHGLDEKVQTSLAYSGSEGAIVEMLQADTEARLVRLPTEKFSFARAWQFILIGVLALAIFVSSFLVPSNIVEGETGDEGGGSTVVVDPPYEFSDDELTELLALIEDVKASNLSADIKTSVVESINKLIKNLDFAELVSERDNFVNNTIKSIEKVIKEPLSYRRISNSLGRNYVGLLAQMIADGVQVVYTDYVIVDYEDVETFAGEKEEIVLQAITETLTKFYEELKKTEEDTAKVKATKDDSGEGGDPSEGEETKPSESFLVKTYNNINTAFKDIEVSEDDTLYKAVKGFASTLEKSGLVLTGDIETRFEIELKNALAGQAYSLAMNKYVTNALREIFGMKIPEDDIFEPEIVEENDESSGNNASTGGGWGKGDMLYGSDDLVYDPVTDSYRPYGEMFNDYYNIVVALLREGNLTEEQRKIVEAYLEILLSGLPKEELPPQEELSPEEA